MAKKTRKLRVAVIGCGHAAQQHLEAAAGSKEARLVACCDIDKARMRAVRKKYKIRGYANYHRMLRRCLFRRRIDVVHICLPRDTAAATAAYCLSKRYHVIAEAPMATCLIGALGAVSSAEYTGRHYAVMLPSRYTAATAFVKDALASGRLGRILSARSVISRPHPVERAEGAGRRLSPVGEGGGVLLGSAIHAIDLVDLFLDAEVEGVSCSMANRGHAGERVEDSAEGMITYQNGVRHTFFCTNNYENADHMQISLMCENGEVVLDRDDAVIRYKNGTVEDMHDDAPRTYEKQICGFYRACRGEEAPSSDGASVLRIHRVLFDLYDEAMAHGIRLVGQGAPACDAPTGKKPERIWYY